MRDAEIKFGYAVTGLAHPDRVLRNTTAQPGDDLLFTKVIGTGVIATALKQGKAQPEWVQAAIDSMTTLNRAAGEIASQPRFYVRAATDVTGFGFIGHARELAFGSGVRLRIDTAGIDLLPGAREATELGCIPGGLLANRDFAECVVKEDPAARVDDILRTLLFDPQTAGGLLLSVATEHSQTLLTELQAAGYPHAHLVVKVPEGPPRIDLS